MSTSTQNKTNHSRRSIREAWERWVLIWHVVFYLTLIVPTIYVILSEDGPSPPWLIVGLSLVLIVWYSIIMVWAVPRVKETRQTFYSVVYLVGAVLLWVPLAKNNWAYFITASSFYGIMWGTLPFGLAVVGNILLTSLIIWIQAVVTNKPVILNIELFLIGAVVIGWSALLALWMRSIMQESTKRKQLIEELQSTQESLAAAERQAGILQERQRMAQEIHDTLAQGFTSIVMQLEAAEGALEDGSDSVHKHIQQARDTARESLSEARRVVQALRPAPLEGAPLVQALKRVIERFRQESKIETELTVTGEIQPLHPDMEVTLLRAMQESLTNVFKHAHAKRVNVTLTYMNDQVVLDIQDDGRGFDPDNLPNQPERLGGGYGLQAMTERVTQIGGELIIESSTNSGTTISIQIPMEENLV
jgi:signal transduction histidine kinase